MTAYLARRSPWQAARRGLARRCPACGAAPAFAGYLKVVERCAGCGEELGRIRADDFPPYATIFVVGHLVIPAVLLVEKTYALPIWQQMVLWPGLTLALTLLFLRPIKGAILGLMWALRIRGDEQ